VLDFARSKSRFKNRSNRGDTISPMRPALTVFLLLAASTALGSPSIQPGDLALRHDIQRLADHGFIKGPTSTWPLAWGPILDDLRNADVESSTPDDVIDALARVKARGEWESRTGEVRLRARASVADGPPILRSFQDRPRGQGEIEAGFSWIGERFSLDLTASGVSDDPRDDDEFRLDGSQLAVALGNVTIAASTLDRWWGPGWDSSLVLSSNARPIPAITIDRRYTDAFKSKWLSWIGTWDASFMYGFLEEERTIPDAHFVGFRFNFRPIPSLELGVTRTAMWCGDGRPCDLDTFWNLLIGRDNRGDDEITEENEPGNQTAAFDVRWSLRGFGLPLAVYGQMMAEDEAGGFPSRYMGQLGVEGSGSFGKWSYRWYAEAADTTCNFYDTEKRFNCAYNHSIYTTGYRYEGRVIGHTLDNDARVVTVGGVIVDDKENSWQANIRTGELNRGGNRDPNNTVSVLPQDVLSVEIVHHRRLDFGRLEIGVGYDDFSGNAEQPASNEVRAFIQWRSDG